MLINAQHSRTQRVGSFCSQFLQHVLKPAFDRGTAHSLALAEPSSADAVPVPEENHPSAQFAGSLPLQDSRKLLPKPSPAGATQPFAGFQQQVHVPHAPTLVPYGPDV